MPALGIIGLINFITCISLGFLVLTRNSKSLLNRSYFACNLMISIYSFGYFAWQFSETYDKAYFWFKVLFFGTILINLMYIFFVFVLTDTTQKKKTFLILFFLAHVLILLMEAFSLFYDRLEPRYDMGYWPIPKFWLHVYVVFWHWSSFYGFYFLIKSSLSATGLKKQQMRIVGVAFSIGYLGGASNWLMWYGVPVPPYPSITISIYVALIAYAIFRHKLMDFNLVMRWGVAYFLLITFLIFSAVPIVFLSEWLSKSYFKVNPGFMFLTLLCFLAAIFDSIKKATIRFVDQIIFRSPDFQVILAGIENSLTKNNSLTELSLDLCEKIKHIWGVSHAGLVIWDFHSSQYSPTPAASFSDQIIQKLNETIGKNDFLVRTLESERRLFQNGIIIDDEITALGNKASAGERSTFWKIRRTMRWLGAAICVPLIWNNTMVGFIVLGKKGNNAIYNQEDRKFLSHLAQLITPKIKELVIDFEN